MESPLKIPKNKPRSGLLYLLVTALLITAVVIIFNPESSGTKKISLNTFVEQAKNEEIKSVRVKNERIDIVLVDNTEEYAFKEKGETLNEIHCLVYGYGSGRGISTRSLLEGTRRCEKVGVLMIDEVVDSNGIIQMSSDYRRIGKKWSEK